METPPVPPRRGFLSELLDAISKFRLVENNIKVDKIEIGDKSFNLENGFIVLGDGSKVKLSKDKRGNPMLLKDGIEISGVSENKNENVELLDKDKKVFSRADISDIQLEFLTLEKKHENIIKQLKPLLDKYRNNFDIGSLLIASTIIRLEDSEHKNETMIKYYMEYRNSCYKEIGRMIYNLFRSEILEKEILPDTNKLIKAYGFQSGKQKFLIQWYDIIKEGYPTAYFVQFLDDDTNFSKEMAWRFNRQVKYVNVYSRGKHRNKLTTKLCEGYYQKNTQYKMNISKPYQLGITVAIKINIEHKK